MEKTAFQFSAPRSADDQGISKTPWMVAVMEKRIKGKFRDLALVTKKDYFDICFYDGGGLGFIIRCKTKKAGMALAQRIADHKDFLEAGKLSLKWRSELES